MIGKIHAARRVRHDQRTDRRAASKAAPAAPAARNRSPRSCESVPQGTRASFRPARRTSAFRRGRGPWKRGNSGPRDSRSRRYSEVFPQTAQAMSRGSPRSAAQTAFLSGHSPRLLHKIHTVHSLHCPPFFFLYHTAREVRSVNQNRSGGAIGRGGGCRMRLTLCAVCDIIVSIQFIQLGRKTSVIAINYRDPRPIYEQIQAELRRLMLTGALPPGSRLPSVPGAGRTAGHQSQHHPARLPGAGIGRVHSFRRREGLVRRAGRPACRAAEKGGPQRIPGSGAAAARARTERRGARVASDAGGT